MFRLAMLIALCTGFTTLHTTSAQAADASQAALPTLSSNDLFQTNSTEIKNVAKATLDDIARQIIAAGAGHIEVGVHSDSQGSGGYNKTLSQRRADAVRDYLIFMEVPPDWLTAVGYGEDRPTASNSTAQGRASNRRVELTRIGGAATISEGSTSASEPSQPTFPHTPTYTTHFSAFRGRLDSQWVSRDGAARVSTSKTHLVLDTRGTLQVTFRGKHKDNASAKYRHDGGPWTAIEGSKKGTWPAGDYELEVRSSKGKDVAFSVSIYGHGGRETPPTPTDNICTVLDYLAAQATDKFPDIRGERSADQPYELSEADPLVLPHLKGWVYRDHVRITMAEISDIGRADTMFDNMTGIVKACMGDRVTQDAEDYMAFSRTAAGKLRDPPGGIRSTTAVKMRAALFAGKYGNYEMRVEQQDANDPDTPSWIVLMVLNQLP